MFNTVLQAALEDDLARWREKGMGIRLGDPQSDYLSILRFADDVLLFSTSLEQLRNMMCDFKKSTGNVGLKIHPEKTKILSNQRSDRRKEVTIDNIKVEVLPVKERAQYLGQIVTFEQREATEIKNRIRAATSKTYLLRHRLHFFNVDITPTLTYASGTCTRSTQHKMPPFTIQTERKYKKVEKSKEEKKTENDEEPTNDEKAEEN